MASKAKGEITSVPALIVTPDKAPAVSGNFEQIEAYLQKWRKQVSKMDLTESNMDQARLIKKEAVAYRNSLTKIQSDIKKTYFNDPKSVFEARMGQLLGVIGEVEAAVDQVLEVEERERVAGINEVIDHYIDKFQAIYKLDEERLARVERKKSYYNKTAEEKARKDDIEQQFQDLKKDQNAYAANIRLIEAACRDEPRLNAQFWIDRLRYDDVAIIAEAIEDEKQRLRGLDNRGQETEDAPYAGEDAGYEDGGGEEAETKKVELGVPSHIDFSSDFKDRVKSMKIELVYPCDLGDALTQLFEELRRHGIKARPIKETELKKEAVF
jgi:uncharacterized protein (DUF849 family)